MEQYLVAAIVAITPGLEVEEAQQHVEAALFAAEEYGYEPEFLLAMAWVESRYQRQDFSRMECRKGVCKRVTGVWRAETLPRGARATFYCGALQVGGNVSWDRCQELMEDLEENYLVGAAHLWKWEDRYVRRDPKCRKYKRGSRSRRTCALYGYGGGWKALDRKSSTYPGRIYRIERRIKLHIKKAMKEDRGNV